MKIFTMVVTALTAASLAYAEDPPANSFVPFEGLADGLKSNMEKKPVIPGEVAATFNEHVQEFALYSLGKPIFNALVEENRLDKQVGGSAGNTGATSLVSNGSVPRLFGLAVENGALYQSVSGSVVTFRLNPSGLILAMAKNTFAASGPPTQATALEKALDRISASASFDLQRGSTPGTFTGERSQLREVSAHFDIWNKRDPRHPSHAAAILKLADDMKQFVEDINNYFDVLKAKPAYNVWIEQQVKKFQQVQPLDDAGLKAFISAAGEEFVAKFGSDPNLQDLAKSLVDEMKSYRRIRDKVFQEMARSLVFTFEYTFNRLTIPDSSLVAVAAGTVIPDVSTVRLILSSPLGSVGEVTLNGSVSLFNSTLPQMRGNLRDIQFSGSLNFRLPEIQSVGSPVLTFAVLGAFLHQQPFGAKVLLFNKETADGRIGVFQTKLTFPAGSNGVRIPLSFTIANRSDFKTEKEIRGSVGLTFDLDKLFSH